MRISFSGCDQGSGFYAAEKQVSKLGWSPLLCKYIAGQKRKAADRPQPPTPDIGFETTKYLYWLLLVTAFLYWFFKRVRLSGSHWYKLVRESLQTGPSQQDTPPPLPYPSSHPQIEIRSTMAESWNTSEDQDFMPGSIIVPAVFSLIFLLGTVGNGLVLAVLLRNGQVRYNTTNLFILNLGVADLCFIIFCVPFQATIYTLDGWLFGSFMCKVVHFFIYLTMYASSFTLAAVSVDRYLAIRYPLKSRDLRTSRNAAAAISVIWVLSVVFAGPYLSYFQIVHYNGVPICVPIWHNQSRKVMDVSTFVFGYLLPVSILSLAYARTIKFLWTSVDPIETISDSKKAKRKVTKMIIIVAVLFCICWLPHHVVILCFWFGHFPFNKTTYAFRLVSHCMSYANSCLNPIVYALISRHFRKRFKQVFTCLLKKKKKTTTRVHVVAVANTPTGFYVGTTEVCHINDESGRDLPLVLCNLQTWSSVGIPVLESRTLESGTQVGLKVPDEQAEEDPAQRTTEQSQQSESLSQTTEQSQQSESLSQATERVPVTDDRAESTERVPITDRASPYHRVNKASPYHRRQSRVDRASPCHRRQNRINGYKLLS
nr:PREDICTED: galanin receptor type 3 [Latimeria chalumnae]|eukprot:XP_014354485.1 PREDICTED: galanin receptor type 3 [Latimeria chalumnae]